MEITGSLANPALKTIYNGKSLRENYSDLNLNDVAYEGIIGALLGNIGGAVNIAKTGTGNTQNYQHGNSRAFGGQMRNTNPAGTLRNANLNTLYTAAGSNAQHATPYAAARTASVQQQHSALYTANAGTAGQSQPLSYADVFRQMQAAQERANGLEYARYKELEHKFVDGSINEREWNELIRLEDNWGQFGGLIKSEKNNLGKRIIHQEQAKWKEAYDSTAKYIGMPVTKEAVEKVALLHPKGLDQSTARKLQEESKRVLSSLIGRNLDTEAGRVYNINMEPLTDVEIGKDGDGRICLPRFTSNHITLHTHPDGNIFSGTDIQSFIMNADMCAMVVVGNNGTSYFVQKTFDYDGFEFTRKWMTVQETLNECIATGDLPRYMSEMEKFLEGGWKYGIQFIKK